MIGRLLRYNTRHHLYFPGGWKLPQLNPYSSSSHTKSGKRTRSFYEPGWMFRLRQRFCVAGRQRCGRRDDPFAMNRGDGPLPDTWDLGPDGNRTCSYCGSIHPADLMEICRKTLIDERYAVEGTTKSYKVYVRQPGVMNAAEGAIKFYMHHAPAQPSAEDQELFAKAARLTSERFEARFAPKRASA
jgi:hypothetical protein